MPVESRDMGQGQRHFFWMILGPTPHARGLNLGSGMSSCGIGRTSSAASHSNSSLDAWKSMESAGTTKSTRSNPCSSKIHSLMRNTPRCPGQKSEHLFMISLLPSPSCQSAEVVHSPRVIYGGTHKIQGGIRCGR